MNELQKKELEILKVFIDICEKLHLRYFLVCGSALGAVKYSGFIPWDDDIDVALFRDDYNVFLKEAPKLLPEHIFLQTYKTDNYPNIFAKLRNSNSTYIEKSVEHIHMNHGIYIDVFPLDGYPLNEKEAGKLERKKKIYKYLLSFNYKVDRNLKGKIIFSILNFINIQKYSVKILEKYEKLISAYSIKSSEIICNHGNWQGTKEYAPKWHYGNGRLVAFEHFRVRIPERYDEYLTQKYGDWRSDLPLTEQQGHHYYTVCDCHVPYSEYKK